MKKYFLLYFDFLKASAMSDLEYRLNILTKVVTDIFWYAAQASVFEVIFAHTKHIAGWDLQSARVFMAMLFLVDALWMTLFHENFEKLSWKVRRGELDLVLAKPVDSQFMLTFQKQNTSYIVNTLMTFIYLLWTLSQLNFEVSPIKVALSLIIGLPVAMAITYSFRLAFATLSVIYSQAEAVNYLWFQIYRLGMRPDPFYPRWLRIVVLTILPVGFIASVPTQIIIANFEWWMIFWGPLISIFLLWVSRKIWQSALKHYSSASS